MTKATEHLLKDAKKGAVLLTRRGKPVAAVVPVDADEWEDWVVTRNPDFVKILKRSEARYRAEGGVSIDEIRRKYGLKKPARKAG